MTGVGFDSRSTRCELENLYLCLKVNLRTLQGIMAQFQASTTSTHELFTLLYQSVL